MSKVAVITGAASGIGKATAACLLSAGWRVIGLDLSFSETGISGLENADTENMLTLNCDVGCVRSITSAFIQIEEKVGFVDAVICSAGTLAVGPLSDMSLSDFDRIYSINTRGAWLSARQAIPLMRKSPNLEDCPRIVFVGSISAIRPKVGSGAYAAQKAALHTLVGVMAAELAPEGILVNAVAPGTVDTPMIRAVSDPENTGQYRPSGASPLGRVAQPEDVAAVIDFFLSRQAKFVTGVILPVDGGTRAAFIPSSA